MANLKKILVAYDGSPHSKAALGWALLLGCIDNAELEVVKVFEPIVRNYTSSDYGIKERIAEQYAEIEKADRQMMADAKSFGEGCSSLKIHTDVLKGPVASTLLDYALQKGFDLIVAGTKGHGVLSEMLVGSVTSKLVSLSKVPILVVKEKPAPDSLRKILVAYDGSDFAKAALAAAIDLAKNSDAKILAVKVSDPLSTLAVFSLAEFEYGSPLRLKEKLDEIDQEERNLLDGARAAASGKGLVIETELLPGGNFADALLRRAEETGADMIVAGSLGHTLLEGLLVGSVTKTLISLSKIPVLVVKK